MKGKVGTDITKLKIVREKRVTIIKVRRKTRAKKIKREQTKGKTEQTKGKCDQTKGKCESKC